MKRYHPILKYNKVEEYTVAAMAETELGEWVRYDNVVFLEGLLAGDKIVMDEQATLLRECRHALDELLNANPKLAGCVYGSTTLGNLRAELGRYRSDR